MPQGWSSIAVGLLVFYLLLRLVFRVKDHSLADKIDVVIEVTKNWPFRIVKVYTVGGWEFYTENPMGGRTLLYGDIKVEELLADLKTRVEAYELGKNRKEK